MGAKSDRFVTRARLGRPRSPRPAVAVEGPVRVELRLPPDVANRLFETAESTGRTVSRVGTDALNAGLDQAATM